MKESSGIIKTTSPRKLESTKKMLMNCKKKVSNFSEVQRYVVLVMDEMKIQSGLVFDKHSSNLVGFIDLGDPMTNLPSR